MKEKCCHVRMLSPNKSCSKDNLDGVIDVHQYNPLIHQQLSKVTTFGTGTVKLISLLFRVFFF